MIKKAILTLSALAMFVAGHAQQTEPCATTQHDRQMRALYPAEIAQAEAQLKHDIDIYLSHRLANAQAKGTSATDTWPADTEMIHIPVVVHIIHNYGLEYISDDAVSTMLTRVNEFYNNRNANLSTVVNIFKPYIGNFHITFHLATKDPQGKPTRGIVRTYSYLSNGGDDAAKIAPWPPDQYLNLYFESFIGANAGAGITLAYAYFPASYAGNPYTQGVISRADQAISGSGVYDPATVAHEIGHYLSLKHTWNDNTTFGAVATSCGDDEVDDTPPTKGNFGGCPLYADTICAKGYGKFYDTGDYYHMTGIHLPHDTTSSHYVNYPDTGNVQNIMNYSDCKAMFSKGQVARGRGALYSAVGFRNNLWSKSNLITTGVLAADGVTILSLPDLPPIADFSANRPFVCADASTNITFTNRSYNDTLSDVQWAFGGGAGSGNSNSQGNVNNTFSVPGWVSISLTATSNQGSNTIKKDSAIYAADPTPIDPSSPKYYQDFNPGPDLNKYPIFNYYGTDHKWELVNNAGVFDNTSIRFANYDTRLAPSTANATQTAGGLYSDFYTPAFDLSSYSGVCNLDFWSAGAFRTNKPSEMNDTLEITYSTNCGSNWQAFPSNTGLFLRGQIANNGYRNDNFSPIWSEWKEQAISVPASARNGRVFFRFRFKSGTDVPTYTGFSFGTGNNFYLDRLSVSNAPLGVKNGVIINLGMSVAPNPTSGAATVSLNGGDNSVADLTVLDVTGKLVYSSSVVRTATTTKVEIPATAIAVKGMYLVKVVTNGATETKKLVVY